MVEEHLFIDKTSMIVWLLNFGWFIDQPHVFLLFLDLYLKQSNLRLIAFG